MPWRMMFRIVRAVLAVYAGYCAWLSVRRPEEFADFILDDKGARYERRPPLRWPRIIPAILGIATILYFATFAVTDAIPGSWHDVDEDGDDTGSTRMGLHWLIVVVGTLFAVGTGEESVRRTYLARLKARYASRA